MIWIMIVSIGTVRLWISAQTVCVRWNAFFPVVEKWDIPLEVLRMADANDCFSWSDVGSLGFVDKLISENDLGHVSFKKE